jgi:hypothetical protein
MVNKTMKTLPDVLKKTLFFNVLYVIIKRKGVEI